MSVGVRFGHGAAARKLDKPFSGVARRRAVGVQRVLEAVDQHVGGVIINGLAALGLVRRGEAVIGGDAEDIQKSGVQLAVFNAVQQLNTVRVVLGLGVGQNVRQLDIGKFHAAHSVTVCVAVGVQGGDTGGIAQNGLHAAFVPDAGADIGAVPNAVFLRAGHIVLVQADGAGARRVDQRRISGGKGGNGKAADHDKGQQQRKEFFQDSRSSFLLR